MFLHLASDYHNKDTGYPHSCEEREDDTESEHKSESLDHTDTEDIEDNGTGKWRDMTIPDSRPWLPESDDDGLFHIDSGSEFFFGSFKYEDIRIDREPDREDDPGDRGEREDDSKHLDDREEEKSIDHECYPSHKTGNTIDKDEEYDDSKESNETGEDNNPERIRSDFRIDGSFTRE
ncbi:MAG: hypothetical protein ACD_71C00173G0004, partial [uncultured bacterium (gcode 4)]